MAILSIVLPPSVIVEVFIADHVRRNIARRFEPVFTPVAFHSPFLKVIRLRERLLVIVHLIRPGESVLLAGSGVVSLATGRHFSRAAFDVNRAGISIWAYVHPVFPWAQNRKSQIR
jgi:hypothetical protein